MKGGAQIIIICAPPYGALGIAGVLFIIGTIRTETIVEAVRNEDI